MTLIFYFYGLFLPNIFYNLWTFFDTPMGTSSTLELYSARKNAIHMIKDRTAINKWTDENS